MYLTRLLRNAHKSKKIREHSLRKLERTLENKENLEAFIFFTLLNK